MRSGYYDVFEAAKLLGVEVSTVRNWVSRGILPRGRFMGQRLQWTKRQLLAARDRQSGHQPIETSSRTAVFEAHCGCGSVATVTPGMDGYLMVECTQCTTKIALQTAAEYIYRRDVTAAEVAPSTDPEAVMGSKAAMVQVDRNPGAPFVYFIRLGSYVKIGTSTDIRNRITALALSPGNLLAVVPGSYKLEKDLHRRFAGLRSFKEWFYFQDELLDYVTDLQRQHIQALVDEASGDT